MAATKFHKIPNLGVNESYGNIDIHNASRLGIPSNLSEGTYQNAYISNIPIRIKYLVGHLNSNYFENNPFDVDNYIDHTAIKNKREAAKKARQDAIRKKQIELFEQVKDNIPQNKPYIQTQQKKFAPLSQQEIENLDYRLLSNRLSLNTTVGNIENKVSKNEFNIYLDQFGNSVHYEYGIHYKNSKHKAIVLNSESPDILFFFLEKVYGKIEANKLRLQILDKFVTELKKARFIEPIIFLLENLPDYIKYAFDVDEETKEKLYKLPDELLWEILKKFVRADRGDGDASYYVLYAMSLITPKYCIQKFREDQRFVIQVYDGLDDRNFVDRLFGDYKYSETFKIKESTLEISNKDVFVTLLNSYIQLHEKDASVAVYEPTGAHFYQGDIKRGDMSRFGDYTGKYWLNSDVEKDKIYLKNRWKIKRNLGEYFNSNGSVSTRYEYPSGYNEEGNYNPLDIVKFTQYNDRGEAITMNAPIILIYHADYVEDWKRIHEGIRLGTNLLMIGIGVATLSTGLGSLMFYATLADIGLATTDILIQGSKDSEFFKKGAGKEFYENWEKIYTIGGIVTFSPVAIKFVANQSLKIANAGADLLQVGKGIADPQIYKKVKELTTKAIHSLEIPNFNKTGLQILKKGFTSIPELKGAEKLQKLGVIFVKGAEDTMAVIYDGIPLMVGKIKEVAEKLHTALKKLRGKKLEKYVDELLEVALDNIKGKGLYGGKVLSKADLDVWAKRLHEKYGTKLEKVDSFDEPDILAQFDSNTNTIKYKDDVTEYIMTHESFHADEMHKIGFDEYVKDAPIKGTKLDDYTDENLWRSYRRELYVQERMMKIAKEKKFTQFEIINISYNVDMYILKLRKRGYNIKI